MTHAMQAILARQLSLDIIRPSSLADAAMADFFDPDALEPMPHYLSREKAKDIARGVLARRFDPEAAAEAGDFQGELFSGKLQSHIPRARKRGEEPEWVRLEIASEVDLFAFENRARKAAQGLTETADAARAYRLAKFGTATDRETA
jgi:hypothetical protein